MTSYRSRPASRVLGVDPGLTRCGLGVVEGVPGRPPHLVAVGVIRTGADEGIAARLLAVEEEIERWLTEYRPDTVAVERVFSQHNVRTVMGTAQAGAVAIVCAARRGLPVALHTPSEVKAAVTGSGRADKDQVTAMVMRLLRMPDRPRPADAADALALAICHLWREPALKARRMPSGGAMPGTLRGAPDGGVIASGVRSSGGAMPGTLRGAPDGGVIVSGARSSGGATPGTPWCPQLPGLIAAEAAVSGPAADGVAGLRGDPVVGGTA